MPRLSVCPDKEMRGSWGTGVERIVSWGRLRLSAQRAAIGATCGAWLWAGALAASSVSVASGMRFWRWDNTAPTETGSLTSNTSKPPLLNAEYTNRSFSRDHERLETAPVRSVSRVTVESPRL